MKQSRCFSFFYDPMNVCNLISDSIDFPKSSLNNWKFLVYILLKPGLENFEHYFASMWDECNCVVVWGFFGIAFLWDWNENWLFPVLWPLLSFPNLLTYWVQRFHSIILYWTGMGEFNSDDHYIYYCEQESLRRNGVAIIEVLKVQLQRFLRQ